MAESTDLVVCPACRKRNLHDARFCSQCGVMLGAEQSDDEAPLSRRLLDPVDRGQDEDEMPRPDPLIGTVVADRYRILEPIGHGGMGVVYRVEHARIGKLMALKLLTGELSHDRELVARFKREALMASKLSHPNTVQVFDFGTADGLVYLAMEYLNGHDLGKTIRRHGHLSGARTAKVVVQVCSSLAEAHELGIVHRDLKPENIMLLQSRSGDDVVKVLDFGLAKLRESPELGEVTTRGAIVGTPFYMSPEQVRGDPVDARSDVYALGALMHTCLTGRPVFDAATPVGVLTKHITDEPVSPSQRFPELMIASSLGEVVLRALHKDPAQRYQSVRELQHALVEELRGQGQSSVDVLLDSGRVRSLAGPLGAAATRDEVEHYERKLRRQGRILWVGLGLVLVAGGLLGARFAWSEERTTDFSGNEHEPNNSAGEAEPLPFGATVRGQIGRRLDLDRSDRDFYRIDVPAGGSVALSQTALPNMSLCTWLYRADLEAPLGRYCVGSASRNLDVLALDLEPGPYLLLVTQDREVYSAEQHAPVLENVSDTYNLSLSSARQRPDFEVEPNDFQRDANSIEPGGGRRARLAWMHDVDVFCAQASARQQRFVVRESTTPRPAHSVLEATPIGGPADGIPVRIHRSATGIEPSPRDVVSPWQSPEFAASKPAMFCIKLRLMPNPWAPQPHPRVAPAGNEEYQIRVETL